MSQHLYELGVVIVYALCGMAMWIVGGFCIGAAVMRRHRG
jgi:hypothetical protein